MFSIRKFIINESQDISLVQCYKISTLMKNGVENLIAHLNLVRRDRLTTIQG